MLPSAVERYRYSGDIRQSSDKLKSIFSEVEGSSKISTLQIAADICIDIAAGDPDNSSSWLDTAEGILDDIYEDAVFMKNEGHDRSLKVSHWILAGANIRRGELNNWRRAVNNEDLVSNYVSLLESIDRTRMISSAAAKLARPKFIELMPVILGARSIDRYGYGWLGRMALDREDNRPVNLAGNNANWDCAIDPEITSGSFIQPRLKLQLKSDKLTHSSEYAKAKVTMVAAKKHGLNRPFELMLSCQNEVELLSKSQNPNGVPLMTTMELDALSETFFSNMSALLEPQTT